jgi:hypothetical protein
MSRKRGIKRLSIALGMLGAVPVVSFLLLITSDDFDKAPSVVMSDLAFITAGGAATFFLVWGLVHLIGWVIDGFLESGSN